MAKMKIKILRIYRNGSNLRVEFEHKFGKESFGVGYDQHFDSEGNPFMCADGITPTYQKEVKDLLEKKYGRRLKTKTETEEILKTDCKSYDWDSFGKSKG